MNLTENSKKVLERRYLAKDENGRVIETVEELFERVAKAISDVDKEYDINADTEAVKKRFYEMMTSFDFLPNSPTLMNAGRPLGQLSACFVLPVGDSMEEIFDAVKYAAIIHKSGGGTGFSFSRLRPKGATVRSTGGVASGPVSFMKVFNSATEAVKQGGTRRGANMGILRIDHPDILEFIQCKQDNNEITNFNISVGITEDFMEAVEKGQDYDLIDPHTNKVVKSLNAREVFKLIVEMAWKNGEPGIVFLDRINEKNPTPLVGEIESTNPCVTGDTWVMTTEGPRQVSDLIGRSFDAVIDGRIYKTTNEGFFKTGHKHIVVLETVEGYYIRLTDDHKVLKVVDDSLNEIKTEWVSAKDLKPGDNILLNNHRNLIGWSGELNEQDGYLLGLLVGDGVLKKDTAIISVWKAGKAVGGDVDDCGINSVMQYALDCAMNLPHRRDFAGWIEIKGRNEYRLKLASLRDLAFKMGMRNGFKTVTPQLEKMSSNAYIGFIRGLFDCDASVQGSPEKGASIRLSQSNLALLKAVQRMLLRLGIASKIYTNRRKYSIKLMPDGKGGLKEYKIKPQHELCISGDNMVIYAKRIGFKDDKKMDKLKVVLSSYKNGARKERFVARVSDIREDGFEDVYDVQVPGINAFDANGIIIHNCGEQPLLPYESCNLGSINLKNMLKEKDGKYEVDYDKLRDTVHDAVHFLDNVIDANKYPLPQIDEMTKGTRKIGLGVMGFADMLLMLNIPYNSEEAVEFADKLMKFIDEESKAASMELAEKRGVFKYYDKSIYKEKNMRLRNATTTTIAPTGTISIIAGTSSGIEPLFAIAMTRNVMDNTQLVEVNPIFKEVALKRGFYSEELMRKIAQQGTLKGIDGIPDDVKRVFVTAHDIDPVWHIRMQAAFQKHVDNAVSKTVNFRHDATVDDVREVYELAYKLGLKGVTIYRDGSRDSQVLNLGIKKAEKESVKEDKKESRNQIVPRPRPSVTKGITEKVRIGCGNLYITVNYDDEGICEVFTNLGRAGGCPSQSEATSRLISIALRSGLDAKSIVEQLKGIRCHSTLRQMANNKEIKVLSCPDAIAKVIEKVMKLKVEEDESFAPIDVPINGSSHKNDDAVLQAAYTYDTQEERFCPECGSEIEHEGGCVVCKNCGYSKCG
ncbi:MULTISPECIES: adenosylcobalamin-dependent ribonucleoside-diphosphate reductase [Thermoanaerobacterium]|uniref:Vitamin B12-dependent ribonucleotide reductase n=2 Tax=Thermoanaerobacterium TaxID=28895 RepID=W9E9N2_9THEO|nr:MULTISPECIES: adenosylcobalamin-dependent ribonucleoside-diphosphate reductase [Thermoanaerobacterium]AFK85982.1 ribonucleoside-diphosphate reductase, adenosylcobalamin-dependent [Thermoanaerobacterium saccharolyticum JW/SL-YS485]ETO38678.1 ribonucleoside-diphosphate reductase [Thermoanaerobacterium aotearoense SCUT27]